MVKKLEDFGLLSYNRVVDDPSRPAIIYHKNHIKIHHSWIDKSIYKYTHPMEPICRIEYHYESDTPLVLWLNLPKPTTLALRKFLAFREENKHFAVLRSGRPAKKFCLGEGAKALSRHKH